MPRNEEGEFEFVLANRQLLSVFFIVVVLLGVFFTMGYIVGRNSAPVATEIATAARPSDAKPLVVESPARPVEAPPKETKQPEPSKPVTTAPQQPEPVKPEPAKPEPPRPEPVKTEAAKQPKTEPLKPIPTRPEAAKAKPEPPKPEPVKNAKAAPPSSGSPSGTYLQLAATTKREADIMVDVLRNKQFKSMAAEIPDKPGLFRVLVGPMADSELNKTRADLQGAGFPGNAALKRSY